MCGRQRIGPFEVTRLATQDSTALAKWLADNGFPHPDGLDGNIAPCIADGGAVVETVDLYARANHGDITGVSLLALIGVGALILTVVLVGRRNSVSDMSLP